MNTTMVGAWWCVAVCRDLTGCGGTWLVSGLLFSVFDFGARLKWVLLLAFFSSFFSCLGMQFAFIVLQFAPFGLFLLVTCFLLLPFLLSFSFAFRLLSFCLCLLFFFFFFLFFVLLAFSCHCHVVIGVAAVALSLAVLFCCCSLFCHRVNI